MAGRDRFQELGRVFRGTDAIRDGVLTPEQLRGPKFQRLFRDVYALASTTVTHSLRCEAAALVLPRDAVVTGRSAATVKGISLARTYDPVEVLAAPAARIGRRRQGLDVRRTEVDPGEQDKWQGIGLASPQRTALDLLLDRELPEAVADLDAVIRAGHVDLATVRRLVDQRHDHGIVRARSAVELADPRAESRPESRMRVLLVLDGLEPVPQYWIYDGHRRLARADLAFPDQRVAVEYEGAWHAEAWALNRDRERLNAVRDAGWDVVFVTALLLNDPPRMIAAVRSALARSR